jgi:hypothetical protein
VRGPRGSGDFDLAAWTFVLVLLVLLVLVVGVVWTVWNLFT